MITYLDVLKVIAQKHLRDEEDQILWAIVSSVALDEGFADTPLKLLPPLMKELKVLVDKYN